MKIFYYTKQGWNSIVLTGRGNEGGEGTVYSFPPNPRLCAKIYHEKYRTVERQRKLEYMLQHQPASLRSQNSNTLLICWPVSLLFDENRKFVGFIMWKAFDNSVSLEELTIKKSIQRLERMIANPHSSKNAICRTVYYKFPFCNVQLPSNTLVNSHTSYPASGATLENRYKVMHNIALIFHYLHSWGHYVAVDVKPENIMLSTNGGVSLVDMDSIQINTGSYLTSGEKLVYKSKVATPEYVPPEWYNGQSQNGVFEKSFDLFGMAVIFYQILTGIHPYSCKVAGHDYEINELIKGNYFCHGRMRRQISNYNHQMHDIFYFLPQSIRGLFIRAFDDKPTIRPLASEWLVKLSCVITTIHKNKSCVSIIKHISQSTY